MGGQVNSQGTGIMSGLEPRANYDIGGSVYLPTKTGFEDYYQTQQKQQKALSDIPTQESIFKEYEKEKADLQRDIDMFVSPEDYFMGEQASRKLEALESEQGKQAFIGERLAERDKRIKKAQSLGVTGDRLPKTSQELAKTKQPDQPKPTQPGPGQVKKEVKELEESDLKTIYKDLLPLFEKELGPEEDEYRRQKYMQLAKFGLGLLAQPGGSLVEAIGRAGEKPLAGLEATAAREAQARRAPRVAALEAAIKQTDPSDIIKKVRALSKLSNIPESEVAKSFVTTGAETTADANVDKYLRTSATDLGLSGGAGLNYTRQVKNVFEKNPSLAGKFNKLVPEKPKENEYYVTKSGDLTRYKDGKFLTIGDKGFAD